MADSGSAGGRHGRHSRQPHHQPPPSSQPQQPPYYDEVAHLNRVSSGKTSQFPAGHSPYEGRGEKKPSRHHGDNRTPQNYAPPTPLAPTTGEFRTGHIEVDSLYGQPSANLVVNSMNAPNNSTMQCGCENIDCPFCNLITSVQMKQSPY